jgi:hypothetical protein
LLVVALIAQLPEAAPASAASPVGFGKSLLAGETSTNPTSIDFGPDGRLYVAERSGRIKAYTIARDGRNSYRVTSTQAIGAIRKIANHDDGGAPNSAVTGRLVTGLLATGSASLPVLYVSSSDPRAGALDVGDVNLDTNSGVISRIRWNGTSWVRRDLVRGLPRSEEVHASNGMVLDQATNTLYLAQGGHTNMGAPSQVFAELPEYALSGAVLSIDLDALGALPYDLPTLDDPTRAGDPDPNDPFGGNDGLNQARIVPGGPVQVYSPGYRNPYDIVIAGSGRMYVTDNGNNAGQGGPPVGEGPAGTCTNAVSEPGVAGPDTLHLITGAGYYGGYPNPTRGNTANTFGGQSPVPSANPIECDYQTPGIDRSDLATFVSSTNGLAEYTASNFGSAMKGDLLAAAWDNYLTRIQLSPDGTAVQATGTLFSNVGQRPLDVITRADDSSFPGTVWVADHAASDIVVFEPNDYDGAPFPCTGVDDPAIDEDGDGFSNADEIDNGTDPCSAADIPPDWDGDGVSNMNDGDDDNDGLSDKSDAFAIDPRNGKQTYLPVTYTWDPGDPTPPGLESTGFTGLMSNGVDDYAAMYDPTKMTIGGAPGVVTIDAIPGGTSLGSTNTQKYGFQFGIQASPTVTGTFDVHTRIVAPFAGITPEDNQSMGLFVGKGDQDNYVKLVVSANGGGGGVRFVKEVGGTVTNRAPHSVAMPGPEFIDLYLRVDPVNKTAQPSYRVRTGGVTGPRVNIGGTTAIPSNWVQGTGIGMAIGIISTSSGPAPVFSASWDLIEVVPAGGASGTGARDRELQAASTFDPGIWQTREPTGLKRQEVSYVESGGKFYLAGGKTTAHQVYDPVANAWSSAAPLPQALDHIQAAAVGGRIFYVGGLQSFPSPHVGTVSIYDFAADEFSSGEPMPESRARGAGGVAVYDGKIYVAGGLHDGTSVPWFDVYDPVANSWTELPDMPRARDHAQAAIVGTRLYMIGGRNTVRIGANDYYDFASGKWVTGSAPLPTLRAGFATGAIGKRIYVIGGEGGGGTFDEVEMYNTVADTWKSMTPMPTARHGIQGVVWKSGILIADGGTKQGGGGATDVHEVFFPVSARPDALVKLSGETEYLGNNVYNATGSSQTKDASAPPGETRSFNLRFQNDAPVTDSFQIQGTGDQPGFGVRYFARTTDVTAAIVSGTYSMTNVPAGGSRQLRVEVTVEPGAPSGTVGSWLVTVSSQRLPVKLDAVKALVTVS